jgi:hypothetical protein
MFQKLSAQLWFSLCKLKLPRSNFYKYVNSLISHCGCTAVYNLATLVVILSTTYSDTHVMQYVCSVSCGVRLDAQSLFERPVYKQSEMQTFMNFLM